jgi:hypothetical protein
MAIASSPGAAVVDANILISLCAKEPSFTVAENVLSDYALKGWTFYAPHVIVAEVLYVLCGKLWDGSLTPATYNAPVVKVHLLSL